MPPILRPFTPNFVVRNVGDLSLSRTEHPLILRAQEAEIPWVVLQDLLAELESACDQFDYEGVRALLLRIVIEYAPQCGIKDFIWRAQNKSTAEFSFINNEKLNSVKAITPVLETEIDCVSA